MGKLELSPEIFDCLNKTHFESAVLFDTLELGSQLYFIFVDNDVTVKLTNYYEARQHN